MVFINARSPIYLKRSIEVEKMKKRTCDLCENIISGGYYRLQGIEYIKPKMNIKNIADYCPNCVLLHKLIKPPQTPKKKRI